MTAMSDVIHLDPTGIGVGGSPDPQIATAAAQKNAQNSERLTECGMKLSDVKHVGVARLSEVTCKECLARDAG
jgi:hypothetical protein